MTAVRCTIPVRPGEAARIPTGTTIHGLLGTNPFRDGKFGRAEVFVGGAKESEVLMDFRFARVGDQYALPPSVSTALVRLAGAMGSVNPMNVDVEFDGYSRDQEGWYTSMNNLSSTKPVRIPGGAVVQLVVHTPGSSLCRCPPPSLCRCPPPPLCRRPTPPSP